jgi:hypothetical protein
MNQDPIESNRFLARRARRVLQVCLAPMLAFLVIVVVSVLASDQSINSAAFVLIMLPFVLVPIVVLVRASVALDLRIAADHIVYRTVFRSRTFRKPDIDGCISREQSNGILTTIGVSLQLRNQRNVKLQIFNYPKPQSESQTRLKQALETDRMVNAITHWLAS